ncbi:insulin-related peptide 2-like [Anticarsia gemmatalis]|uniref:insulin-related peptide 2-like n=1 Tax=Anticarsia gemmatalis TaxID=129554 RepID=UPI003F777F48
MKYSLVLALVLVSLVCVSAQVSSVYCGRRLSNALAVLCWDADVVKRAGGWALHAAGARTLGGARHKRRLVDECCYKPCTVDELLTYC